MLLHRNWFGILLIFALSLPSESSGQSKLGNALHFLITPDSIRGNNFGFTYSYGEMRSETPTGNIIYKSLRAGIRFSKMRHKATIGYTWFPYDESLQLYSFDRPFGRFFDLGYYGKADVFAYTINYEHFFVNTRRFIISVPLSVGVGTNFRSREEASLGDDLLFRKNADIFYPIQGGIYGQWKATRYIGVNARYGYRYINNDTFYKKDVSNTYFNLGITIRPILMIIDISKAIKSGRRSV